MTKRQQNLLAIGLVAFFIPYSVIFFYVFGFGEARDLVYLVAGAGGVCLAAWLRARNKRRSGSAPNSNSN